MIQVSGIFAGTGALNVLRAASLPEAVANGQFVVISDVPALRFSIGYGLPTSPAAGDVWVHVVDTGAYPVEIDDGLSHVTLTLGATRQYIGGEWVYRDAYVGVDDEWKMCSALSPLGTLPWLAVGAIAGSGEDLSLFFEVGDQKQLTFDAAVLGSTSVSVEIIGMRHDDLTIGGKAQISFCMVDCFNNMQSMNASNTNAGSWGGCALRATLRGTVYDALPADLRAIIKEVNKPTSAGSQSATITATADNLFLLSEIEIFGAGSYSFPGEGAQYSRFSTAASRIKKVGGAAAIWWERSPSSSYSTAFCAVNTAGAATSGDVASDSRGVACGFCI